MNPKSKIACPRMGENRKSKILLLFLLLPLFLSAAPAQAALTSDSVYFPETGFTLKGAFKTYWERQGGLDQFGFPLTNQVRQFSPTEPDKWYWTQYFQRAIFEYHPEKAGTKYEVLLRLVGNLNTTAKGRNFPRVSPSVALSNRGYFPQTGHSLSDPFLSYWRDTGGLPVYGYPISEEFTELNSADGKLYTVQYFERARFEWHPENAGSKYEVLLGFLGRQELQLADLPSDDDHIGQPYRTLGPPVNAPLNGPAPSGGTPPPPGLPQRVPLTIQPLKVDYGYGINVWAYDNGRLGEKALDLAGGAGMEYIRQQLRWDYVEPQPGQYEWSFLDHLVGAIEARHQKLMLSVVKAPKWANATGGLPDNPDDFYNFMLTLSDRYKGRVAAYEIWNEENIGRETGGAVSVPRYVATLKAAYTGIKKSDPNAVVVTGGNSATGVNTPGEVMDDVQFVEQCYEYNNGEWRNYFDVLGVHTGGAANSPDEFWPVDPPLDLTRGWTNHPSFYFRRFENHREVMVKNGDGDKQIWLTEFGWATANETPGFEYGALINEQQQADYIVQAFQRGKNYQYMGVMFLWNLNFSTLPSVNPNAQESAFAILRRDYSPRPAYTALQNMKK